MKKLLFVFAAVAMAACSGGPDLSKITKGMPANQVAQLIGKPDKVQEKIMGIAWWWYGENAVVVVSGDTVANVVPDVKQAEADMAKAFSEFGNKK